MTTERVCEWCGDTHGLDQLCQRAQRGMTRRSFVFLFGAGLAGAVLAPAQWPLQEYSGTFTVRGVNPNLGKLVAEAWNNIIGPSPMDHIFTAEALAVEMRRLKDDPTAPGLSHQRGAPVARRRSRAVEHRHQSDSVSRLGDRSRE